MPIELCASKSERLLRGTSLIQVPAIHSAIHPKSVHKALRMQVVTQGVKESSRKSEQKYMLHKTTQQYCEPLKHLAFYVVDYTMV